MSKKIGYIYSKMLTKEAIESALIRASKHKKKRRQVRKALENKEQTIKDIQKILLDESFVPQAPFEKTIWDTSSGKERHVAYVRFFPDAIIHTLIVERLEEIFSPRFDPHSCSAIPKRGGAAAKKYVEKAIQEDPEHTKYCLKLDISKYFQSIDKDVLMKQLHHIIKDKRFLKICSDIINSYIENPEQPKKGIAIGFFPSQWFGNSYLTDLDRYIRTLKGVHYYCRYMDDMVLFSDNKEDLHQAKELIESFLNSFLKLKLKSNYQLFPIDKRPLDFVGYIFYRKYIILRRKTANKTIKQSRRIYKMQKNNNPIDFHNASGFLSRSGQCKHFNSRLFSKRYVNNINLENLKGVVKNESLRKR